MTFESARDALLAPAPSSPKKEWSLGPTRALLERLGSPDRHFPSVHVGGTNGKGSVCHLVYSALREAGFRVGLYTSPDLVDIRERFIVDDRPIPRDAFAQWVEAILPTVRETQASFFEATTAVAFADFAARNVDIAVVEVGLGGRLDATNVLTPLVSAVTQISMDHAEYLGDTLESIGREKAGIAKAGVPLVIGEPEPGLVRVITDVAVRIGARPVLVPAGERYEGPLGLAGAYQRRNAAVARAVLRALPVSFPVSPDALEVGFGRARVPGRFDHRGKWIFDVAHNPGGVVALIAALNEYHPTRPVHALVGVLKDKDWKAMLPRLASAVDQVWLTEPPSAPAERRWDLSVVAREVGTRFKIEPDFDKALRLVQEGAGTVLVTGSFHTVGDAMARLPGFAPLGE